MRMVTNGHLIEIRQERRSGKLGEDFVVDLHVFVDGDLFPITDPAINAITVDARSGRGGSGAFITVSGWVSQQCEAMAPGPYTDADLAGDA